MEGFRAIFQGVGDPRKSNATKHDLIEMLVIALLATLSGSSSCAGFARYAECNCEFLKEFMELKGGPPSHDAFSDLFNALDPEQLSTAMTNFAKTLAEGLPRDQVAVDGKALRGAIMDAKKKSALHLVQAFEPRAGLVLGQVKVDGKSNEITAIPALLEILDLDGRTVTADAMHCQRETSARIVEKGGDYVLPAKGVNAEVKFPESAEAEFPTFSVFWRRARSVVGSGLLSGPASFFRRGRRRDGRIRSDVFGNEVGVLSGSVACAFDSDDDCVVEEPVEEGRRDDGIAEDVAPFGEASVRG